MEMKRMRLGVRGFQLWFALILPACFPWAFSKGFTYFLINQVGLSHCSSFLIISHPVGANLAALLLTNEDPNRRPDPGMPVDAFSKLPFLIACNIGKAVTLLPTMRCFAMNQWTVLLELHFSGLAANPLKRTDTNRMGTDHAATFSCELPLQYMTHADPCCTSTVPRPSRCIFF